MPHRCCCWPASSGSYLPLPYRCIISLTNSESLECKQRAFVGTQTCWQHWHLSPSTSQQGTENLLCIYRLFCRKCLPASTGNVDFTYRTFERGSFVTAVDVDQIYAVCFCMLRLGYIWAVFRVRVTFLACKSDNQICQKCRRFAPSVLLLLLETLYK